MMADLLIRRSLAVFVAVIAAGVLPAQESALPKVAEVPPAVRDTFKLAPYYKKHVDYHGFPVVSSEKVSDAGLLEARHLIHQMLADRQDVLKALIRARVRFAVMAPSEMTTDIPEHSDLTPKEYWDKDPSTIRAMLVLLEGRGLVSRARHPNDSRARVVTLSAKGRRLFERLWKTSEPIRVQMVSGFSADETRLLVGCLRRLIDNISGARRVQSGT
jgi:DNA-binding PadR family transcriptional regulator